MRKSSRRRTLPALLAAIGCLVSLANPAVATTTTVTVVIDAGTLDISVDGDPEYEEIIEFGGEDHTCTPDPAPVSHITLHDNTTTNITDVVSIALGTPKENGYHANFFDFGGMEYQRSIRLGDPAELGFGTNAGAVAGTAPDQMVTQHILLEGEISTITNPGPPCVKGTTICHFAIELTVTGPYNRSTMSAGPLNGSGLPQIDFCNSPFAGWADGIATVTGLMVSP